MRTKRLRALAPVTGLVAVVALIACRHTPAAASGGPASQRIDSLEGIVRVVGSVGSSETVLRTDDGRSVTLSGPASLSRVSGLRVVVRGERSERRMNAVGFRVIAANGVLANDGTLAADGAQLVLQTADGRRLPVTRPSAGLRAALGHRVWIAGPLDGETVAYGVID